VTTPTHESPAPDSYSAKGVIDPDNELGLTDDECQRILDDVAAADAVRWNALTPEEQEAQLFDPEDPDSYDLGLDSDEPDADDSDVWVPF
jgi:hypothetical protein